jgi:hypothetical protein
MGPIAAVAAGLLADGRGRAAVDRGESSGHQEDACPPLTNSPANTMAWLDALEEITGPAWAGSRQRSWPDRCAAEGGPIRR